MAQKKYTELPAATTPTGTEVIAFVQGGQSKRGTLQQIADLATGTGVETVTGDGVDNTDPDNPVIGFPSANDIGLGNVNNTSDANKPVSTAQQTALDLKENLSNKATDFSTINDTLYPSVEAVQNQINSLSSARITYSDLNLTGM